MPTVLADPARIDHLEVVEIASGEVVLFWDLPTDAARRMARRLREDLASLEADDFMATWSDQTAVDLAAGRSGAWGSRRRVGTPFVGPDPIPMRRAHPPGAVHYVKYLTFSRAHAGARQMDAAVQLFAEGATLTFGPPELDRSQRAFGELLATVRSAPLGGWPRWRNGE